MKLSFMGELKEQDIQEVKCISGAIHEVVTFTKILDGSTYEKHRNVNNRELGQRLSLASFSVQLM
jgi:hypothetical protein